VDVGFDSERAFWIMTVGASGLRGGYPQSLVDARRERMEEPFGRGPRATSKVAPNLSAFLLGQPHDFHREREICFAREWEGRRFVDTFQLAIL
jgi:hypothetical protein